MKNNFTRLFTRQRGQETIQAPTNGIWALRCLFVILCLFIIIPEASAQINMHTGTSSTCSDMFYDSRGATRNYRNNEDYTLTIAPSTAGGIIRVTFSAFSTDDGFDFLYIYDGNSVAAPLIGTYTGTGSPGTVTSSAADGSLTFRFTSDYIFTYAGWEATVNCLAGCSGTPVAGTATASAASVCPGAPVTFGLSGATVTSGLTYQWDSSATGAAGTFVAIAGATAKTLSFTPPPERTLYYRCQVSCSGSSAISSSVKVSVSSFLTTPYLETFESIIPGENVSCAVATSWTGYNDGFITKAGTYSTGYTDLVNHTPGGNQYLWAGYGLTVYTGERDFWFTPGIILNAGSTYEFSYWYLPDGTPWDVFKLGSYVGSAQDRSAMTALAPDFTPMNTSYQQVSVNYNPPVTGTYYFGIYVKGNYGYGMAIDDIGVQELPPCSGKPASGGIASVDPILLCSPGSATLFLKDIPKVAGLSFQWWKCDAAGTLLTPLGVPSSSPFFTTGTLPTETYFRCITRCTLGSVTDTAYSNIVRLNVGALTPPYLENFETATPGTNTPCAAATSWTGDDDGFDTKAGIYSTYGYTDLMNHTPGGNQYLWAGYGLTVYSGTQDFWFTPGIALKAGITYQFSYWYLPDGTPWDAFELGSYVGPAQDRSTMTALAPDFVPTNTSYQQVSVNYTPSVSGVYYFGIYVKGNYGYGTAIDDIGVQELPPCTGKPSSGGLASISPKMLCSPGSVTLSLSDIPKVANLEFQWWECDAAGTLLSPLGAASVSPILTSGTISSGKHFRCITHCTLGSATDTTYSNIVKVDVGAIIPPYIETFESGKPGTNMPCAGYTYDFGETSAWNLQAAPITSWSGAALDNHTPSGNKYLLAGSELGLWSGSPYEYWFTPAISFTAGKLYQLSYWYQTDGEPGCIYSLGTYMGAGQTAADMTIPLGLSFTTTTKTYKEYKVQFTATASGDFYIGIQKSQSDWGNGIAIDDIGLQEVPACSGAVTAGSIVSDPLRICASGASAILDLDGSTLATGLTYEWFWSNSAAGGFTSTGGSTLPYTTDPLTSTVWYKAVVTCAASGLSDTTPAFRINVGGLDMPYKEDFESTATGEVPLCSDATLWGAYYYEGWYVCANGTIGGPYKSTTPGGKNFLIGGYYMGSPESTSEDNYWFTPGLNLKAGYTYDLSFNYLAAYSSGSVAKMGVYIGKSQSVSGMTTVVANYRPINNNTFLRLDTVVKVATDEVYYLGFRKSGTNPTTTYTYEGVAFDDINLNYAPCNSMPSAGTIISDKPSGTQYCPGKQLTLTNIGATIALVPGIQYQWQRKSLSTPLSVWSAVAGATGTMLSADTLVGYEYRLAVACDNTADTAYTPSFLIPQSPAHPPVTVDPPTSPVTFCLGDTVKLRATDYASAGAVYDWMLDGEIVPGWKFSDIDATKPGTYMAKVTSALSSCPAYSTKVTLMVNDPGYTIALIKPADSIICAGATVTLSGSVSKSGVSYQWRKNNVAIPGATGGLYVARSSGYYTLTASDGIAPCPAISRTIQIIVKPTPAAVLTTPGGTTTACTEEGVLLEANKDAYSYEWMRGGATIAGWVDSAQHITTSGTYSVKVRMPDGCVGVSPPVRINILPAPDPVITRAGDVLGTAVFSSYQWFRNGEEISGETGQYYNLTKTGLYKVRVTGTNGCTGESLPIEALDSYLGIPESQARRQIRIYPNPTNGKVYIESPLSVNAAVKDLSGRTILYTRDAKEIDLGIYADGTYLLILEDKGTRILQQRVTKITR